MVLLGQDPYHNGSATGLCFDVKLGNPINKSLQNMYKELEAEDYHPTQDGNLTQWAHQGVLMLNTALTVAPGVPESHLDLWRPFFDYLMTFLGTRERIVWILLGKKAMDYADEILARNPTHAVVQTSHPSPLSAHKSLKNGSVPAFLGSGVFRQANELLKIMGHSQIVW